MLFGPLTHSGVAPFGPLTHLGVAPFGPLNYEFLLSIFSWQGTQ